MFLDHNNILNGNQFGFRLISHSYHSTHHAIMTLTDIIIKSLDCGDIVIGKFLDLRKAFDTFNHSLLVKKLNRFGVRGEILLRNKQYICKTIVFSVGLENIYVIIDYNSLLKA